jgi:hypothetical protein
VGAIAVLDSKVFNGRADTFRYESRAIQVGCRQDDGKFLAAIAGRQIECAFDAVANCARDLAQAFVTPDMTVTIVELLEVIEIGLTPAEMNGAIELVRQLRAGGTTIVFVEHLMRAVVALSDRIAVLDQGALIALGEPRETMLDSKVISVYLGKRYAP